MIHRNRIPRFPGPGFGPCLLTLFSALSQAQDNSSVIEEMIVTGTDQSRYLQTSTNALSGVRLDFLELPRVVEIIPEQLLLDQKVTELDEALRNVPGVSFSDGFGGSNNDFLIRGFRRNTVYRNGMRVESNFRVNTANLERIQVIKGPASITYGQVEPGGLVDIVTKKPLEEQRLYVEARYGSYNSELLLADWSQNVGERFAFRVNASSESSDTFRDLFRIDRDTIAFTGIAHLSDSTSIDLDYEYRDEFRSFDRGTLTVPTPSGREIVNELLDIDLETRFGEPFEEIDTQFQFANINLDHSFSDAWRLKLSAARETSDADDFQSRPVAAFVFDAGAPIDNGFFTGEATPEAVFDEATDQVYLARRSDGSRDREIEADYAQVQVNGEFATGSLNHRVAFGADYRTAESSRYFVATPVTDGTAEATGGTGPLFDLQNPVYGLLPDTLPTDGLPLIETETDEHALFVNDYLELSERLGLLLGLRYDVNDPDGSGPADEVTELSPQVAANYRLGESVALFASYAEAFEPNTAFSLDDDGSPSDSELFDPEDSTQYEAGVKGRFLDDRLNVSASLYQIEKDNVVTVVDSVPQLVKGQESRGAELSVGGQPVPGMNIVAGYAYTDAEILTGGNAGNRPRNVAPHTLNLWWSYEVQSGLARGLGGGIGAFYMSDRYGDDANSWKLGSYQLLDASLWYTLPAPFLRDGSQVRLQLAAKNLLDEEYYSASGGDLRVSIGTPRMIYGSVALTF